MYDLIAFFAKRHFLVNTIFIFVLGVGVFLWFKIPKEELPDFEFNRMRVNAPFPGVSAEDVEELVTIPIEKELKTVEGIRGITSNSSVGLSSISVEMDPDSSQSFSEIILSIKDTVQKADIPGEVKQDLGFRQFKTSEKAILDVGIILSSETVLSVTGRHKLQRFVRNLENQLLGLEQVGGVDVNGSLQRELQIVIDHKKLKRFSVPLSQVVEVIRNSHFVSPSGSLSDHRETKVSVVSEYKDPVSMKSIIVRSTPDGGVLTLGEIATIGVGYEKASSIQKVQGHEAIVVNVKKSSSSDILSTQRAVLKLLEVNQQRALSEGLQVIPMDDESFDVRNRLRIIFSNGLLGFVLILLVLFVFLDWRSGLWAAFGIPFALCFTVICAYLLGYSVNNVSLCGIIIVLGIVVDDAIIVSENIVRLYQNGMSRLEAAIKGASMFVKPVSAAILTTCVAFIPLYFISGRLGGFIKYIPVIIFAMLGASLLESLFVLPSHLSFGKTGSRSRHWFQNVEQRYSLLLVKILKFRIGVILSFVALLGGSGYLFVKTMKFELFPREEAKEVFLAVEASGPLNRFEMAEKMNEVEKIIMTTNASDLVSVRSTIARSHRGGEVKENRAFVRIELKPVTERERSLNFLIENWESQFENLTGFKKLKFIRHRFGQSSGSPIAIEVRESSDEKRSQAAETIAAELRATDGIDNVEIDEPLTKPTFEVRPKQRQMQQRGVDPQVLSSTARAYLNGQMLYRFVEEDEEINVVVSLQSHAKRQVSQLNDLLIENRQGYLMPMRSFTEISQLEKPTNIKRIDHKRTTLVYADLKKGSKQTPLSIAEKLENGLFPRLQNSSPSTLVSFSGEVKESRESGNEMLVSIVLVLFLIYAILIMLFDSVTIPAVIVLVVPFGLVGVVLAFLVHGMSHYGFFAAVGAIGMIGVVVNDSIIMVERMETLKAATLEAVANIAASRMRAIVVTTTTTVAGLFPTAYGLFGYDSMLSEMMLAMGWGLLFGTVVTLVLTPSMYSLFRRIKA